MGYGGVSGRPSFPNMDRSVFRAYELCLVPRSFLEGSEPLALALALGAFWRFRRRRIFVAVWLESLAVTVRPLKIFVLVGIGILICSAVGNLFWRCAADRCAVTYHATMGQPTRLVPMVIYLDGPSTVLWWER